MAVLLRFLPRKARQEAPAERGRDKVTQRRAVLQGVRLLPLTLHDTQTLPNQGLPLSPPLTCLFVTLAYYLVSL